MNLLITAWPSWLERWGEVFELIYNGIEINKENIVGFLEGKRKAVGNVIRKGLLRDAAEMVRKGK
ncbi:hypothetical protein SAMN03097705_0098 [[Enterobacter] aerogenes]|nr:hypothetical protein SAMN03097705_0098 [[Enterobacter] aerogenes] [Klebsiella aerogenes]